MGNSRRFGQNRTKRSIWTDSAPYLLSICFGILAVLAGGVACEHALIGIGMLYLVMTGYISCAMLLTYFTDPTRHVESGSFQASRYPDTDLGGLRQAAVIPITATTIRRYRS